MSADLDAPLRRAERPSRFRFSLPFSPLKLALGAGGGVVVGLLVFLALHDDPWGGEPFAVTPITAGVPPSPAPLPVEGAGASGAPGQSVPQQAAVDPDKPVITIIDGSTGKRTEVSVPKPTDGDHGLVPAPDPELIEKTRSGLLPKIAADGRRPLDTYARPVTRVIAPGRPRIALIVGGLGISASSTVEAITKLPPDVTLGFAPYGNELEKAVQRARNDGHEVILQVPMEPFDYPDNDPGPQTLLTSLQPPQNLERLHWFMSRFPGYVGIANYMGARMTAHTASLTPVMDDIGKRGLMIIDDGLSARSQMTVLASSMGMMALKADLVVDVSPTANDIDAALLRLEEVARERGAGLGMATGLPISLERLARWTKTLEARGISLVPVSALAPRAKPAG